MTAELYHREALWFLTLIGKIQPSRARAVWAEDRLVAATNPTGSEPQTAANGDELLALLVDNYPFADVEPASDVIPVVALVHIGQAPLIARYFSFRSETSSARLALGILGTPRVSSQDLLRLMTPFGLSPRECEVVALKVRCVSLGAIGKELGLSVASVRSIWLRAALKLGCETTPEILHLIDGLLCAPNALRLPTFFNRQG